MTSRFSPHRVVPSQCPALQRISLKAAVLVFGLGLILLLVCTARAQDGVVCGSQAYLDSLPVKPPKDPSTKRQIQLVNCSDQLLLGAANAAHEAGKPPYPVFPQEDTWEMQPYVQGSDANVLTIDIPQEWYGQFRSGGVAPNFWARTGCRYDPVTNRAQCETGGCGGQYDCSSANLSPPPGTTLAEWTFYQQFQDQFIDSPDISAVNGANLTIDISPMGGDDLDPLNPKDFHWLKWNYPLTVHGHDLREPTRCTAANGSTFSVARSEIDQTRSGLVNYPLLGYVIVDANGKPTMPAGDNVLACLSNCGKYKFPEEVGKTGCKTKTDPNCYAWTTFCAGNDAIKYSQQCDTDADCVNFNGGIDYHIACFKKNGPGKRGTCELRAFYKNTVSKCNGVSGTQPAAPASTVACNNTYGSVNPLDQDSSTKFDWADQPVVGTCDSVTFNGNKLSCIGDDTLHLVLHGAYTWPNDPEVFQGNAKVYRIIFSPEGRGLAPITPAQGIPSCDVLPANYKYADNRTNCSIPVKNQYAMFGIGVVQNQGPQKWQSNGHDWPCFLTQRGAGDNGVLCRWNPPPAGSNCTAPLTDTYVTKGACGRNDTGTSLTSGDITPASGDPLFLQVSIPKVLNTVSAPVSLSGCVPDQGLGSWTLIASQTVHGNQGFVAWYKGTANTSLACKVTMTMATENPAELKVYDVPKFNGTVETMSTASGDYVSGPSPSISAGSAATAFSNDLQLGALLMVNNLPTPVTYWSNWLTNGANELTCLANNTNCPKDDGTDFLPGHGPFSANSESGHNNVAPGTQYFHRDTDIVANQSQFSWVGLAIYVELNP